MNLFSYYVCLKLIKISKKVFLRHKLSPVWELSVEERRWNYQPQKQDEKGQGREIGQNLKKEG